MLLYIIPAKAGIQSFVIFLDSHLRGNDNLLLPST